MGLGALNTTVLAQVLLKEFAITPTIVRPQGGNTAPSINRKLDERFTECGPTHQNRPRFPHSQSLPSGSVHKPLILIHQRADRMETTVTDNLTKLVTCFTALSNSMKLSQPHTTTQDGRVMVESSDKTWSTGEGSGKPLQYSCLDNPINGMKRQKNYNTRR